MLGLSAEGFDLGNCEPCCLGVSANLYRLYKFWTLSVQQLGVLLVSEGRALLDGLRPDGDRRCAIDPDRDNQAPIRPRIR